MDLKGKVALVTGGAQGIGRAHCEVLASHGVAVVICDLKTEEGKELEASIRKAGGRSLFLHLDVTNKTEFEECFKKAKEEFGRIDILVNNAGILDDTIWRKEIEINLVGSIEGTLLGLKYIEKGGAIILTSSIAGVYGTEVFPVYAATKGGVNFFVKSLGHEQVYNHTGIKFYSLCPGSTETPIFVQLHKETSLLPGFNKGKFDNLKMQKAETVANCLVHLLTKDEPSGSIWLVENDTWRRVPFEKLGDIA